GGSCRIGHRHPMALNNLIIEKAVRPMNSARGCSRFHFVRATRTSEGMRGDSQKLADRRVHYLHHRLTWPLAVASRNAIFATPDRQRAAGIAGRRDKFTVVVPFNQRLIRTRARSRSHRGARALRAAPRYKTPRRRLDTTTNRNGIAAAAGRSMLLSPPISVMNSLHFN